MLDTGDIACDIARDLVADIGWLWAVVWVVRRVGRARWSDLPVEVRLLVAVVFA
jgi:hypothetical protein